MAQLSELLLKSAIAAVLKADKLEVTQASPSDDGAGIAFEAKSKSGQVRVRGIFSDPQGRLELEEPSEAGGEPEDPAIDPDEEDEEPH